MLSLISTISLVSFMFSLDVISCVGFSVVPKLIQEASISRLL